MCSLNQPNPPVKTLWLRRPFLQDGTMQPGMVLLTSAGVSAVWLWDDLLGGPDLDAAGVRLTAGDGSAVEVTLTAAGPSCDRCGRPNCEHAVAVQQQLAARPGAP